MTYIADLAGVRDPLEWSMEKEKEIKKDLQEKQGSEIVANIMKKIAKDEEAKLLQELRRIRK